MKSSTRLFWSISFPSRLSDRYVADLFWPRSQVMTSAVATTSSMTQQVIMMFIVFYFGALQMQINAMNISVRATAQSQPSCLQGEQRRQTFPPTWDKRADGGLTSWSAYSVNHETQAPTSSTRSWLNPENTFEKTNQLNINTWKHVWWWSDVHWFTT